MDKLERMLQEEKEKFDNLEIADNMEDRLRAALDNTSVKNKKRPYLRTAAIVILVFLLSYNMDTLAFYAKKIIGYDNVMSGTLRELNEMGKGQIIDKSYTFRNGVEVVLDGVMLDDNNLVTFYTISDESGKAMYDDVNVNIRGFSQSGSGTYSSDGNSISWVTTTHHAPKFYENKITIDVSFSHDNGDYERGQIKFKLDRNQAVGKSINFNINKKIKLGNRSIRVDSMTASPTATVVKGNIQNIFEFAVDYFRDNRMYIDEINFEIYADQRKLTSTRSSRSSDHKGSTFEIGFDALPAGTSKIELRLVSLSVDQDVDELIQLDRNNTLEVKVLEEDIIINDIYEDNENTYISFTTDMGTVLTNVSLLIDGEKYELQETIYDEQFSTKDSEKSLHTRTMRYKGIGDKLELDIQRIRYAEEYDEIIYVNSID